MTLLASAMEVQTSVRIHMYSTWLHRTLLMVKAFVDEALGVFRDLVSVSCFLFPHKSTKFVLMRSKEDINETLDFCFLSCLR
jgi:hypothetical protein